MEGYLKKWINLFQQWKYRYFILHEDCLHYCDTKGSQIKGTIHLKIANIAQTADDPLRIIINSGTNQIEIKAPNIHSQKQWLQKLQEVQDYARCQFDSLTLEQLEQLIKVNKTLDPAYKKMLITSNNQKIEKSLVEVYENGAKLDEILSELLPQISSTKQKDLVDNLQKYTHQIKVLFIQIISISIMFLQIIYIYLYSDDTYFYKVQQSQCILEDFQKINNQNQIIPQQNQIVSQTSLVAFFKDRCQVKYRLLTSNPAYLATEISNEAIRTKLPKEKDPNEKINIWSILKDSIGKDLSKFAVPVYLNEPISMLQRLAEQMEYSEALDKANAQDDSCLALCFAMGFAASVYAGTINRTKKPFNPLLGETFEYVDDLKGYKFISEQVSHHPPISAGIGESKNFIFQGDSNIKNQFWGKSFEVKPLGHFHIFLKRNKWDITFKKCTTAVKNIFIGQMYIDHYGVMEFKNHTTGDFGELNFQEKGAWSDKGQYQIEGWVNNKDNICAYKLNGKWNSDLICKNVNTGESLVVWKRYQLPVGSEKYYQYTLYAMQLNNLNKENIKWICPTDSRLRPDQRALEYGLLDIAADEKFRLEQKQRARRKENELSGKQHDIVFFEQKLDQLTGELEYKYKGGYWEAREKQDWSQLPILDLY
ncbi:oxysterol-binding protein, putative [Ichthyophthirius multifiliis]|uniref:Oxysterol-binding protein, putative n=1 Tax=Ichthyophthirius multifiliis TaxID=5932 RepID=G0QVI1_ICHMU|nr:oxysterol-binding protein, putative [Ichthyophthirius multifiliis]EGR30773.1 oxysterol-binding protein, putative [Ichthyophthirius multifiliis]|eukprot:XP_004032360.1 oxysterol-binding protein, putative [Ichthyophthirius multifiliis]